MAQAKSRFMKPLKPSSELSDVIGTSTPLPRTEVVKLLWAYIKKNTLQDPNNKRSIVPDEKLARVFGSHDPVNMFRMSALISKHLTD